MSVTRHLRPALAMLLIFTLFFGGIYPAAVTLTAHLLFPAKANGSLITVNGKPVGSRLIGQHFTSPRYFWGRPSATTPPYYPALSSASQFHPTHPALIERVRNDITRLKQADPGNNPLIPVDLITASASGLDPHISPAAALYQAPRIARARNLPESRVRELIERHTEPRLLGFLGEARVNVLEINLALDEKRHE